MSDLAQPLWNEGISLRDFRAARQGCWELVLMSVGNTRKKLDVQTVGNPLKVPIAFQEIKGFTSKLRGIAVGKNDLDDQGYPS